MTPADRAATVKKLMSHVEKRGGELSFDDFAAWSSKTNRQIAKYRAYQVYLLYISPVLLSVRRARIRRTERRGRSMKARVTDWLTVYMYCIV